MRFLFASSNQILITTVASAVAMGIVLGIFKGIEMLRSKWSADTKAGAVAASNSGNWQDITNPNIRFVTSSECQAVHKELKEDMVKGSDKMGRKAATIYQVEKELISLRGQVETGFANLGTQLIEVVNTSQEKHEARFHTENSGGRR